MLNDILADIWNNYRGRLLCSVFGLFVGVMVLWLGFFQALFLLLCIGLGFFIGYKLDMKEDLMEWLDRLKKHFPYLIWLNPEPMPVRPNFWSQTHWQLAQIFPMFDLSAEGLEKGMKRLMAKHK